MSVIEDKLEIRDLVAAYNDATNRGDLDGMVNTYAPDGVLTPFDNRDYKGHAAIREIIHATISAYEWIFHMTHTGLLHLEGDVARGRWWISEMAYAGAGENKTTQFYGVYQDKYIRTETGWRFAHRNLNASYMGRTTLSGKCFPRPEYMGGLWTNA